MRQFQPINQSVRQSVRPDRWLGLKKPPTSKENIQRKEEKKRKEKEKGKKEKWRKGNVEFYHLLLSDIYPLRLTHLQVLNALK